MIGLSGMSSQMNDLDNFRRSELTSRRKPFILVHVLPGEMNGASKQDEQSQQQSGSDERFMARADIAKCRPVQREPLGQLYGKYGS
ncbi:hypothetical protein D3C80_1612080 [compost metagenome]